jgi:hypothetical protein
MKGRWPWSNKGCSSLCPRLVWTVYPSNQASFLRNIALTTPQPFIPMGRSHASAHRTAMLTQPHPYLRFLQAGVRPTFEMPPTRLRISRPSDFGKKMVRLTFTFCRSRLKTGYPESLPVSLSFLSQTRDEYLQLGYDCFLQPFVQLIIRYSCYHGTLSYWMRR